MGSTDETLLASGCSLLVLAGVILSIGICAACKVETQPVEMRGAAATDSKDPSTSHINMSAAFSDSRLRDSLFPSRTSIQRVRDLFYRAANRKPSKPSQSYDNSVSDNV